MRVIGEPEGISLTRGIDWRPKRRFLSNPPPGRQFAPLQLTLMKQTMGHSPWFVRSLTNQAQSGQELHLSRVQRLHVIGARRKLPDHLCSAS